MDVISGWLHKGDNENQEDNEHGGQFNNISPSECETRDDVGAAREARKEARREKQRAKKLAKAAKSPDAPKWLEKSRSVHEGVALSKGADSFRWGISKFVFFLGFPFQNENLENLK